MYHSTISQKLSQDTVPWPSLNTPRDCRRPCSSPSISLPAIPAFPSLYPISPQLISMGVSKEKAQSISNEMLRLATRFREQCEARLHATWTNLARMPSSRKDHTPLEDILESAYIIHRHEYVITVTKWVWETLKKKYGLQGVLPNTKPIAKMAATRMKHQHRGPPKLHTRSIEYHATNPAATTTSNDRTMTGRKIRHRGLRGASGVSRDVMT